LKQPWPAAGWLQTPFISVTVIPAD
jgi:hypothetical protein